MAAIFPSRVEGSNYTSVFFFFFQVHQAFLLSVSCLSRMDLNGIGYRAVSHAVTLMCQDRAKSEGTITRLHM